MEIDPRKKYAMRHKDKCDRLPEHIRIHIPECKRNIKDYVIGPKPRPGPPAPKPLPTWNAPLDVPFRDWDPNYAVAATLTGLGASLTAERIRGRRARAPRGRVAPEEGERGSRRRMRARIAPEERERLIRAPAELPPPEAVAAEADSADSRLASGVRRALDVGDRIERAGRTVPSTSGVVDMDPRDLPRANPRSILQSRLPPPSAPAPVEMERELPPSIDDPDFEMPDRPITTQERARVRRLRSGTSVLPDDPNYARTSRAAPRGAIQPRRDGTTARPETSDLNPSVRPEPKTIQLTKRRKIKFRAEVEEFAPTEHPSEAGPSGTELDPAIQAELDSGTRTTAKGKGKAVSTRASRAERTSSIFDNMSGRQQDRGLQGDRETRGRGLQMTSFMSNEDHITPTSSTDDMLDDIGRLQNRTSRSSIRGPTDDPAEVVRGRGSGRGGTIEDPREPTEISDDQGGLGGEGEFDDVPLLSTSDSGPPRMSNYTKIRRALQGVSPLEQINKLKAKVSGISAPTEQTTTRTVRTQASRTLATDQGEIGDDKTSIATTRQQLSSAQSTLSQDRASVVTDQATVTSDTTALSSADLADDQAVSSINKAVADVGMAEDGGAMATFAENLDGGVGVSQSVAERLGLFGEKLAATTGGKVIGGALKVIGTPIRVVQAVGDAAGDVLKQGVVKIGTKIGGDIGGRIALTAARATGLVASAAGITTGGGVLDPVTDAIGLGLLLAIPLQMAGTAIRHAIEGQEQYNGIAGATKAGDQTDLWLHMNTSAQKMIKKAMKGVPMDTTDGKWWKPATIKAHSESAYQENQYLGDYNMAAFNFASKPSKGNEPVYYNDSTTGKSGFVVPLNDQQLKNAMATYQQNPDAFNKFDPLQLQIMGLNPAMSQGKAGATKVGNIYIPSSYQSGKKISQTTPLSQIYAGKDGKYPDPKTDNYSNAFISWNRRALFQKTSSAENFFTSSTPPTLDPSTYASDTQTVINGMTNATAKAYMENQLAWFKYYNTGGPKPSTKIAPPTDTAAASALTDATTDLTNAQNQLAFQITSVKGDQTTISNDQSAVNKLQSQITNLEGQAQTTTTSTSTAQQLQNYQDQANAYNLNVAQQVQQTESNFMATTGLTAQDYQGLNQVLQNQITATGVTTYTQNQLANLPGSSSGTVVSQQGPTGQNLTTTGVNTRASPSPSGNSGSVQKLTTSQQSQTQSQNLTTSQTKASTSQENTNLGSYFG